MALIPHLVQEPSQLCQYLVTDCDPQMQLLGLTSWSQWESWLALVTIRDLTWSPCSVEGEMNPSGHCLSCPAPPCAGVVLGSAATVEQPCLLLPEKAMILNLICICWEKFALLLEKCSTTFFFFFFSQNRICLQQKEFQVLFLLIFHSGLQPNEEFYEMWNHHSTSHIKYPPWR